MKRVPASELTRKELRDMTDVARGEKFSKSELIRKAVRFIVEEALEQEVTDAVGRDYYEVGANSNGYRNGYRTYNMKSAEGPIHFKAPQVSDREIPFKSKIRDSISGRTEELEDLAVEMYARGLSTRDIEKTFSNENGSFLSKSAVSRVTERLWEEYQEFASRDLSELKLLYMFVDGIAEKLHLGHRREAVLAAWGFLEDGSKVLIHLSPGTKESTECCKQFFNDMKNRGLIDPICVVTDGAPGLMRATEECFPNSLRQRCLAHKVRNIETKVPEEFWNDVKADALAAYRAASIPLAEFAKEEFIKKYEKTLPTATKCFIEDFEACIAQLQLPVTHRRSVRTTNLLERLFLEERRRTKTIPHAFGERPLLKLMYASLIRASESWRKMKITSFELKQLERLREDLVEKQRVKNQPIVKKEKSQSKVSSKIGT